MNDAFFAPIANLAETSRHARPCPEISDSQWVLAGIQRVLEDVPSGRAFLQEHGTRFAQPPKVSNYFSSLHSERRAAVLEDVVEGVLGQVAATGTNRLGHIPELADYVCFAVDMHWHKAATHDERYDGKRAAVGHCFSLQLHDQSVRHLAVGEGAQPGGTHDPGPLRRAHLQLSEPLRAADRGGAQHQQPAGGPTSRETDLNTRGDIGSGWPSDVQFAADGPGGQAAEREVHSMASIVTARSTCGRGRAGSPAPPLRQPVTPRIGHPCCQGLNDGWTLSAVVCDAYLFRSMDGTAPRGGGHLRAWPGGVD
ncbi:MAG: hypothetical protein Q7T30_00515 [Planctomycetota bacterium]|nr:hypothetical protein [Planctomycetota bacterium]